MSQKSFTRNKEEKIRLIFETFADLVNRNGYDSLSTRHIAKAAGISVGTIYHYFPGGKHAIASRYIDHVTDELFDPDVFKKLGENGIKEFLEELLVHPELKEGPRAWNSNEIGILEECIPIISDSAQNWTLIAETLKIAGDEYKEDCINHVNFGELHNIVLYILTREEQLFTKLSKIKN